MIEVIGYWFCVLLAFAALAGITGLVAYLNIRASRYFVDMLGGWNTFLRYRKWYLANELKLKTDSGE